MMLSTGLLKFLMIVYGGLIGAAMYERNVGLLVYFIGAAILTAGILIMK